MTFNAVDLDNLLLHLPPELADTIWATTPTAFADQLHAAAADSRAMMKAVEPTAARLAAVEDVDDWLRLGLFDAFLQWTNGAAKTCLHAPTPIRPEPVWAAAWKPGLIVCTGCMPLLKVFGDADKRCDRCGHICAGPEAGDGIYTLTVWLGAFAYQAGACTDCHTGSNPHDDEPPR
jgi:hypothetical protein